MKTKLRQRVFPASFFVAVLIVSFHAPLMAMDPNLNTSPGETFGNTQSENGGDSGLNSFGVQDGIDYWIPASQFQPLFDDVMQYQSQYYYARTGGTGNGRFAAHLNLPQGAMISGFRVLYSDDSSNNDIFVEIQKVYDDICTPSSSWTSVGNFSSTGTPGQTSTFVTLGHTVDLRELSDGTPQASCGAAFYSLVVQLPIDALVRFKGVRVFWYRQISPAPLVARFSDVPTTHPFFQEIEALASSGITTGYPDGTFKPDTTVTRKQMAAFLARALGLHWAPF